MTNVTNTVKSIWADMVQKRLWPVAVVLVLLLVAIPVVLAKPAPQGPPPPPPAPTAGPAPLVTTPAAIRSNTGGAHVAGKFHDPFKQLHVAKSATTSGAGTGKGPGAAPGGTPAGGGLPGGSGGSGGSSGGSKHHSSGDTVKKLKIRFGKADSTNLKTMWITPGTPLPAPTNPLIVFLDFGKSGKASHWLVSSDVTKTEGDGTGTCKPSTVVCSELELRQKSTQFFDLSNGDQYQLDVLDVATR
jgi:hypothetical protein